MKEPLFALAQYETPAEDPLPDLLELIRGAREQVLCREYGFTIPEVVDALNERHAAGLDVRGIFDSSQAAGRAEKAQIARVTFPHLVGRSAKGRILHEKEGVFDGKWTWGGSWNWTEGASDQLNEVVVIRSVSYAALHVASFEADWLRLGGAAPATARPVS